MHRLGTALAGTALLAGALAPVANAGDVAAPTDYQRAYRIGLAAYTYGLPLLTTNATFRTMTSTNVSQGAFGPVNQFNNVRGANTASSTAVVAPGSTSLSSIAWLDLAAGPQVLHVPKVTDHDFVLALLDPYTTDLVNLGNAANTEPGDYVVCAPAQCTAALPSGTHRIDVDYQRIWIIGSTQLKGPDDVATVNAIQDQYTLTPLTRFEHHEPAPTPAPVTPVPIRQYSVPTGLAFFDQLGQLLQAFPPPARDAAALADFARVGIGPGRTPSTDAALSAATRRGLAAAVAAGPAKIQRDVTKVTAQGFTAHHGYLLGGFGTYGTDYVLRAVISQVGLGAFTADQAIYAMTWTDDHSAALDGSTAYVLHMATPPPTREGWSLTVYNLQGQLMANALNRYAFTSISPITRNADGSIDLYLQATPPDAAHLSNWLPVTAGEGFEVTWRLFAPEPNAIPGILDGSGWQPPRIARAS